MARWPKAIKRQTPLTGPATLGGMRLLKFELLLQVAPALILGLYWTQMNATAVFVGMLSGAAIAATITLGDPQPLGLFNGP